MKVFLICSAIILLFLASGVMIISHHLAANEKLFLAVDSGQIANVFNALNAGANPNAKDRYLATPLLSACFHNNYQIAQLLLEKGAHPNMANDEGTTPLMFACQRSSLQMVKLLVTNGASITAKNLHGETAKDIAKTFKNEGVVEYLSALP